MRETPYSLDTAIAEKERERFAQLEGGSSSLWVVAFVVLFIIGGLYLSGRLAVSGASGVALLGMSGVVVLLTLIDVEFGIYCLIFGMLLSPEIKLEWFELPGRDMVIRLDDIMIILVAFSWFAQTSIKKGTEGLETVQLTWYLKAFLFLALLSTTRGILKGSVPHSLTAYLFVLKFAEFFFLFFLILNNAGSLPRIKGFMRAYFITVVIVSAIAIYMSIITGQHGRATTPFETEEEPGTLGGYLLFSFALAGGLMTYSRDFMRQAYYLALMAVTVPPFIYTQSRASYSAFVPMMLSLYYFSKKRGIPSLLIIISLASLPFLPGIARERVEYTFQNRIENILSPSTREVELDPSSAARLERWRGVMRQWMYTPIIGQGMTGVGFVDSQAVRVLGELGLAGIWLLFQIFRHIIRSVVDLHQRAQDNFIKGLALGYIAGTFGLIVHGVTANTFVVVRIAGPFWLITGLMMHLWRVLASVRVEEEPAGAGLDAGPYRGLVSRAR